MKGHKERRKDLNSLQIYKIQKQSLAISEKNEITTSLNLNYVEPCLDLLQQWNKEPN